MQGHMLIFFDQKRGTERQEKKEGWGGGGFDEVNELPCLILQVFTEQTAHTVFFFPGLIGWKVADMQS